MVQTRRVPAFPAVHAIGIGALPALWPRLRRVNLLVAGALTTAVMALVTVWSAHDGRRGDGVAHTHTPVSDGKAGTIR